MRYKFDISLLRLGCSIIYLSLLIFLILFSYSSIAIEKRYVELIPVVILCVFITYLWHANWNYYPKEINIEETGLKIDFINGKTNTYSWDEIRYPKIFNFNILQPYTIYLFVKWKLIIGSFKKREERINFNKEMQNHILIITKNKHDL